LSFTNRHLLTYLLTYLLYLLPIS